MWLILAKYRCKCGGGASEGGTDGRCVSVWLLSSKINYLSPESLSAPVTVMIVCDFCLRFSKTLLTALLRITSTPDCRVSKHALAERVPAPMYPKEGERIIDGSIRDPISSSLHGYWLKWLKCSRTLGGQMFISFQAFITKEQVLPKHAILPEWAAIFQSGHDNDGPLHVTEYCREWRVCVSGARNL